MIEEYDRSAAAFGCVCTIGRYYDKEKNCFDFLCSPMYAALFPCGKEINELNFLAIENFYFLLE